jgi:peptidoglycan/xylan/chitin deacetylase (PgdA/CDA1 family)
MRHRFSPCEKRLAAVRSQAMSSRAPIASPLPRATRSTDYAKSRPLWRRVRSWARERLCAAAGVFSRLPDAPEWVLFPLYHWILDDQRAAFAAQLGLMRRHGDVLGLDDALSALSNPAGIGGRYFCLTFDDGFRNWHLNATPILVEHGCTATFFLPTEYIGRDLDRDWDVIAPFYQRSWQSYGQYFEFLSWDECRQMQSAGMTFGSHTRTHVRLSRVADDEARRELVESKQVIERELGRPCRHFACPWGRPGVDFDPDRHPPMAQRAGYATFLTTRRGSNFAGASPWSIRRNDLPPDCGPASFRFHLARRDPHG